MARSSAMTVGRSSTFVGARVTLSSTVMCGNRLKLWNTMPTSLRKALTSTPRPLTRSPPRRITPSSMSSSALMHRRRVDLPLPDAPMRHTTWWGSTSRSTPRSTSLLPKRL